MTAYAERFASLTDARITSRLGEVKRRILQLGEELEGSVNGRVGGFVNGLLSDLETHSCRIAVIGQIKAGKSTLINALIRRPDLLPTDINPSTAVITKLYFGASAEQNNTALFQFFSDDEWDRIMSGGRAGAMTMQRHEALRPEQLDEPLEELRQRAEMRLGPQYPALLGKHHLFSSVTAGLLEQYVSAGDYADLSGGGGENSRHFSDITKTAEIFLEGQPLGYPSVIIDTPGVNDPFLVRDEITHGNLGEADIYLVVLTAQQPLSGTDMALLRMLKGLQKDRIIAVVNRVDIVNTTGGERRASGRPCAGQPQARIPPCRHSRYPRQRPLGQLRPRQRRRRADHGFGFLRRLCRGNGAARRSGLRETVSRLAARTRRADALSRLRHPGDHLGHLQADRPFGDGGTAAARRPRRWAHCRATPAFRCATA